MKKKTDHISDEILVKYLLGETSETEADRVSQWLSYAKENKKYFDQFKLIWDNSRNLVANSTINEDEAWIRFKDRTEHSKNKSFSISFKHLRVAALIIILVGMGTIVYFMSANKNTQGGVARVRANNYRGSVDTASKVANEPVCNSTPCPLEICITQTFGCKDVQSSDITTCSTIEPDRSGQLLYKAFSSMNKDCMSRVKEIRIKRVSTGEMIVLNAHTKPVTAQVLFAYITGQKKGDVVAGVFHADCNNNSYEHGLKFDNSFGDLILQ